MIEVGLGWLVLSCIVSMFLGSLIRFGTEGVEEKAVNVEEIKVKVVELENGRVRVSPYDFDSLDNEGYIEFSTLELALIFVKEECTRILDYEGVFKTTK